MSTFSVWVLFFFVFTHFYSFISFSFYSYLLFLIFLFFLIFVCLFCDLFQCHPPDAVSLIHLFQRLSCSCSCPSRLRPVGRSWWRQRMKRKIVKALMKFNDHPTLCAVCMVCACWLCSGWSWVTPATTQQSFQVCRGVRVCVRAAAAAAHLHNRKKLKRFTQSGITWCWISP